MSLEAVPGGGTDVVDVPEVPCVAMITRFGSLFAGHVDLDDHGLDATPVNDRWLSNERLLTVFGKATRIAQLMDRRGFDVFWLAEHTSSAKATK